jgi:hypothetical protein
MRPIEIANPLAVVISKVASDRKTKSITRYCQSGNYSIGRFSQIWLQIRAVVYFYEVPPVLVPLINGTGNPVLGLVFQKN